MSDVETIIRLRDWIRKYGHEKQKPFIDDLTRVLDLADRHLGNLVAIRTILGLTIGEDGDDE